MSEKKYLLTATDLLGLLRANAELAKHDSEDICSTFGCECPKEFMSKYPENLEQLSQKLSSFYEKKGE